MVLLNAIYFNGTWTHEFDEELTHTGNFYLPDSSLTECRMMSNKDSVQVYKNNLLSVLDLPYGDRWYSMTLLLPNNDVTLQQVISGLTPENWTNWRDSLQIRELDFVMPKFKFEYEISLKDILIDMGMEIAFDPARADFSEMFTDANGWIDKVKHKSFVRVDEKGTEAAAGTVVVVIEAMPDYLIFNRPYIFMITEKESGTILFMGRVSNPIWQD